MNIDEAVETRLQGLKKQADWTDIAIPAAIGGAGGGAAGSLGSWLLGSPWHHGALIGTPLGALAGGLYGKAESAETAREAVKVRKRNLKNRLRNIQDIVQQMGYLRSNFSEKELRDIINDMLQAPSETSAGEYKFYTPSPRDLYDFQDERAWKLKGYLSKLRQLIREPLD